MKHLPRALDHADAVLRVLRELVTALAELPIALDDEGVVKLVPLLRKAQALIASYDDLTFALPVAERRRDRAGEN